MTALAFLGLAVVLSVVGSLVLWLRTRERVSEDSIEQFARGMRALAPDAERAARVRRGLDARVRRDRRRS